jgi:predicted GIY-YIG superfamily endonuclease
MCVYLICFERSLKHAHHYVGYARDLEARLAHHRAGTGANLMRVIGEAGIGWSVARVWEGEGRTFERKLKNTHRVRLYCPVCAGKKVRNYQPKDTTRKTAATQIAKTDTDRLLTF